MQRQTLLLPVILLVSLVASIAGLLAFVGNSPLLGRPVLRADLTVQSFALPSAFGIDPQEIAADLSLRLQTRARTDLALRTLLGDSGPQQVADIAIPRLLNASVIRRMIGEMDSLGTVIDVAGFSGLVTGTVANNGDETLTDVAMTVPDAVRAETVDGRDLEIATPSDEVNAVNFGDLDPGEAVDVRVWMSAPAGEVDNFAGLVRLGARGGLDGQVLLRGSGREWMGADLEVLPAARWLIAGVLAAVALFSFAALALTAFTAMRSRRAMSGTAASRA